jgi:hypothetical protein
MKTILSYDANIENERIKNMESPEALVRDYIALPLLPVNKYITIAKLGIYNWENGRSGNLLKYQMFTNIDRTEFPEGKNPQLDYMPNEGVSPVVIIDITNKKYRVADLFWFKLSDIYEGLMLKQRKTNKKVFPLKIFIDENIIDKKSGFVSNKWLSTLTNAVGIDFILK